MTVLTAPAPTRSVAQPSPLRLHMLRGAHLVMAVGLAIVTAVNCLLVVVLAAVPWPYTWRRFAREPGDRWQ